MEPYFSYYGGKQRIASWIVSKIPMHTVYCEPFAGGAAVMFKKGIPRITNSHHYREVLNDTNSLVYNFYKQMRDNPKELIRLIESSNYSKELHNEARSYKKNDDVKAAFYFFVNINQSFSNKLKGGWGYGFFSQNHASSFNLKIENLKKLDSMKRLANCYIDKLDAIDCIKKWDSPQTLFYIDPPYVGTDQGHYSGYTEQDFKNLIDTIDGINGSFLLSCYDQKVKFKNKVELFKKRAYCTASGKGQAGNIDRSRKATKEEIGDRERVECLYRKFSVKPRKEIRDIYLKPEFFQMMWKYNCYMS